MAELEQGLDLDLADALACHAKALADLLQGSLVTVDEPKAELDHAPLAWDKAIEGGLDRKLEHGDRGGVRGGRGLLVLDEIAELGILFMADRCLQRDRRLRRETRASLLMISPMWTGMRIVRAWSAMARVTACRIHQVA